MRPARLAGPRHREPGVGTRGLRRKRFLDRSRSGRQRHASVSGALPRVVPTPGTHKSVFTPMNRTTGLVVRLAAGQADALSGRLISAGRDDLDDLVARAKEIRMDDLYALRFQT